MLMQPNEMMKRNLPKMKSVYKNCEKQKNNDAETQKRVMDLLDNLRMFNRVGQRILDGMYESESISYTIRNCVFFLACLILCMSINKNTNETLFIAFAISGVLAFFGLAIADFDILNYNTETIKEDFAIIGETFNRWPSTFQRNIIYTRGRTPYIAILAVFILSAIVLAIISAIKDDILITYKDVFFIYFAVTAVILLVAIIASIFIKSDKVIKHLIIQSGMQTIGEIDHLIRQIKDQEIVHYITRISTAYDRRSYANKLLIKLRSK